MFKLVKSPIILVIIALFIFNLIHQENLLLYTLEFYLLMVLIKEDEESYEVSIFNLLLFFIVKIIFIIINGSAVSLSTIIFANILFTVIYLFSNKSMGLGDVILNGILSISYSDIYSYFLYFTFTFTFGAIDSIIKIRFLNMRLKSKVPFIKYLVLGYYFTSFMGGRFVF